MPLASVLNAVLGWLRAGYPDGVPESDYIPLVAVLARRLSTEEVRAVAAELGRTGQLPVGDVDIGTTIMRVTNELPREEDVDRVRARLALGGWPPAHPHPAG